MKNNGILWCPHCGQPHRLGERFCARTGKPLDPRMNRMVTPPTPSGGHVLPLIDGKYRIVRRIGRGGMGEVFEAENVVLGRRVAVKIVSASRGEDAGLRLQREALAIAALQHPNICDVYDAGRTVDGKPYLVLEHLAGEGLDARLRRCRRLSPGAAIEIFSQILSAVQTAHSIGIVHRDLKPANVFLVERVGCAPLVKVLDFGFAKDLSGTLFRTITRPGVACGTPQYMAPEQLRTDRLDARADLFAVGVILFEALTGHHPFAAAAAVDVATKILRDPAPPVTSLRPELPAVFDAIVSRALEKSPEHRFSSAVAMQRALIGAEAAHEQEDEPPESYSDTRPLAMLASSTPTT